jgi:hypothetical protein
MDNNFGMSGGSKYTLDDFNEATGVSSSTKTSGMNYDQMAANKGNPSNSHMSSAAN